MKLPVVHLYTVCWDEADMLGFFFRHYDPFVDRYVIYDDGSTDGSREILAAHPKVELRSFARVEAESFVLSHKAMQDEAWKESRGRADWVIVTAIDEHLHLRGRGMADYLAEQRERGVTLIPALGFDMNTEAMPDDAGLLVERVTRGRPRIAFNKLSVFDPGALRETGFGPGRHAAEPVGALHLPARDELMLWHYKHLGFDRNATREATQALRLGTVDHANGFAQQYLWTKEKLRRFWDEMEAGSADLAVDGFVPDATCIRPLWWEAAEGVARVAAAPLPPAVPATLGAAPTISVLIKSYNHAPYVRQTIESVLDQSFQDFEIVVTDDGSTDGTLAILQAFDDPRIRLEAHPHNLGISAAMNATIARARGRYLAILNSDDWALPGRLARQVAFLDANPHVSLVFGQPRPVGEDGLPTAPFNDFTVPLRFPDYSRRTWLRQFFFEGNCLCAPTAMIRREAYEAAGAYDPRLTNMQDYDMWVRMLIAGHGIHVLPEPLSAFRIRDNDANTSAPTVQTMLRSQYEIAPILGRFVTIDDDLFREVFGEEGGPATDPVALRVAAIAQRQPHTYMQRFALDTLHAHARTPADFDRLRAWSGTLDVFNLSAVRDLQREFHRLDHTVAQLTQAGMEKDQAITRLAQATAEKDLRYDREVADLNAAVADAEGRAAVLAETDARRGDDVDSLAVRLREADAVMGDLRTQLEAALASRLRMRESLSWRSTAFLRWIGRTRRALWTR
ncbi:hypothetical protein ASG40_10360 [Methylobacterium sp. Leaf399]|uniref:glycosyltransferase family 2 protein n=1 Tax=Methylobacterium sp. Leaf399 TaxID=1736364 RepID=UPI000700FA0E|nr:glycosyltransferase [Methylobacterium sp. Leaf399]KQT09056.1 hypothetical protein ASG40_10360 [Methylobacterium sp. Leaf399]